MTPEDKALETLITAATHALQMTAGPRIAQAQRFLVGLRTPRQVQRMESLQKIARRGHG